MYKCFEKISFIMFFIHSIIIPHTYSKIHQYNHPKASDLPYYLKVPTNVSAYEGSNVILSCHIENLNDKMVFWIRNSDLQILTAGLATFSSDNRFRVNHENAIDEKDWSLLITNVKLSDSGLYECQINTEVKMKLNINLEVKEYVEVMEMDSPFFPHYGASIDGKFESVLKQGQTVTLTCRVNIENEKNDRSNRIDWMKNDNFISLKTRTRGISIDTVWSGNTGTSRLTLVMLDYDDEGNYSCKSNSFNSEHVTVKIVRATEGKLSRSITSGSQNNLNAFSLLLVYLSSFVSHIYLANIIN